MTASDNLRFTLPSSGALDVELGAISVRPVSDIKWRASITPLSHESVLIDDSLSVKFDEPEVHVEKASVFTVRFRMFRLKLV